MSRILDVYLREEKAGQPVQAADAGLTFTYDTDHLSKKNPSVSDSMPLREEPYLDAIVRPFFSGLLPDERARKRLAAAVRVSQENAFGLLEIIGGGMRRSTFATA
ncbi:serine/threonine-protein kinase HipA [Pseudovibrio denitrificans]|uniref:Serine/threonine-protein kinase HipA n=1 Tax=Pseudovibrio denitrificans TaxID=258256 RepID=A0A1I7DYW4_9HYPH|nr:HipA N-terminal domain-containing protein [Pseudovibrio denitrificans]SFU16825.1 serine/threonine-protein kinase HipA [Pseudovibrio denitrificans]